MRNMWLRTYLFFVTCSSNSIFQNTKVPKNGPKAIAISGQVHTDACIVMPWVLEGRNKPQEIKLKVIEQQ